MRYLRKQNINQRSPYDQRLQVDINDNILMSSPAAVQIPAGGTSLRPITGNRYGTSTSTDLSGMIRYNTDINQLEGYQAGSWRSFRFKEANQIIQQNLGAGDSFTTYFGPLSSTYDPVHVASEVSNFGGQNLLVIVENVIQIFTTNYTVEQNPSVIPGEVYLPVCSDIIPISTSTVYFNTSLPISEVLGFWTDGLGVQYVSLLFTTFQAVAPFSVGSTIIVTEFIPNDFNGTRVVTSCTANDVQFAFPGTPPSGLYQFAGSVTSLDAVYPSINIIGASIQGSGIPTATTITSVITDPTTDALISVGISHPTTASMPSGTHITIQKFATNGVGYYLNFSSPVPLGRPVTVLHGFDR